MEEKLPNRQIVRISRLQDQGNEFDLADASVEERFAAMWELARSAWAFNGEPVGEQRLLRHIENVSRLRR